MKIGIFFGGQSREREISFAGGRTVYDNLDKSIFEPVLIFVDSLGNFIQLDWPYAYKGTIRDFYPPFDFLPSSAHNFQVYPESLGTHDDDFLRKMIAKVGKKVSPEQLPQLMDMAFLALHGPYGEDGNLQGLLEWYNIPYTGSGILPSAIGVNKIAQKELMKAAGFKVPAFLKISRDEWESTQQEAIVRTLLKEIGLPMVVKAPNQGSSIGVSIVKEAAGIAEAVNKSFFNKYINLKHWSELDQGQKKAFIARLIDIREGIGMPVYLHQQLILHPDDLWQKLDEAALANQSQVVLKSIHTEEEVLVESFIEGKEFSCIVVQDEHGKVIALPPTEIVKRQELFDYRSKYLPGISRKETPINLPDAQIEMIRSACSELFSALHFDVYARLDGFITSKNKIFLNDPNTTSGMLPSSFFFHQAAEIGLNPSKFITFIIRASLAARIKTGKNNTYLRTKLAVLDKKIVEARKQKEEKIKVAVLMGGFSSERHISVESGRNIYEKLASSPKYLPIPVFLTGSEEKHELFQLPINIMLKDNADDIKTKIRKNHRHSILDKIAQEAESISKKYVGDVSFLIQPLTYKQLAKQADFVFIALHGRPGEDGAVQAQLDALGVPYNGSSVESSRITINKYETNSILRSHGILVANHALVYQEAFEADPEAEIRRIEGVLQYPLIAKPADDGCSSAVKKIKNKAEFRAFAEQMFRKNEPLLPEQAQVLQLKENEEFPQKGFFLVEELIEKGQGTHFLEITGGLLTTYSAAGELQYEIFHPSEALASGEILSLEEKFLAGEGQNITPPRYDKNPETNEWIGEEVKRVLQQTAEILKVEGYCRIDAFVRIFPDKVETIIIEVNSLPGMTPATAIFHQSALSGYKPYEFIDKIIAFGFARKNKQD